MEQLTLVIGNKNYSSWSLRPWLAMKVAGLSFAEELITLDAPDTRQNILRHSPAGRVPILKHGALAIWDSLAICEYIAELAPAANLWPATSSSTAEGAAPGSGPPSREARAVARSVSAEMHSGFGALRSELPMNICGHFPHRKRSTEAQADIARVLSLWGDCRRRFGHGGPFLFGAFTIADAMFAPVVSRCRSYDVELDDVAGAYCNAIWSLAPMRAWAAAAALEPKLPIHEAFSTT